METHVIQASSTVFGSSKPSGPSLSLNSLPAVSLDRWFNGNQQEQLVLAGKVNSVCRTLGFMHVKDHGIADETITAIFRAAQVFFAMTDKDKEAVHFKNFDFDHGYVPLGALAPDAESFDCGVVVPSDAETYMGTARLTTAPNLWPRELMGFRPVVENYLSAITEVCRTIFRIWACSFALPLNYFDRMLEAPLAQLRLIHYPCPTGSKHCDYEAKILARDEVGRQELMINNALWIEVAPTEGALVVRIGEMMARWTNNVFLTAPQQESTGHQDAFSIPFCFGPSDDAKIACLPPSVQHVAVRYNCSEAGEYKP